MHIEPGIIAGPKILLSYATAAASITIALSHAVSHIKRNGLTSLIAKSAACTLAVFTFFEIFFHYPVGVSEVHLILGTSLLLLFGVAPTAIGLTLGLFVQGSLFAPFDLPQFGANITTLLMPLFAAQIMAQKVVKPTQSYVNINYTQAFKLSLAYQGGIIVWVAFWAFYGQGFSIAALQSVATFGAAYSIVILVEPLVDLGLLALAKGARKLNQAPLFRALFNKRLFNVS